MIKIIKDINPYGFEINKGAIIYPPKDITNTGIQMLTVYYKEGNQIVSFPIVCSNYKKSTMEFLNEICRLNTKAEYLP